MRHDKLINFTKLIKKISLFFKSKETLFISTLDINLNNANNEYGFLKYDILNFDKKITYKEFELSEIILKNKINIIHKGEFQNIKDAFYIKLFGKITTDYKLENIEIWWDRIQWIKKK